MSSVSSVVVLGCGFTGIEVARRTREAGARVLATTRARERVALLEGMGLEAVVAPELSPSVLREKVEGAHVLVSYPPDGQTDSRVAPALGSAARVVYISSTGVYGAARGRVDERTPVDPATPTARARLDAEHAYLEHGAAVLRAAGIYGPFRGLHRRLLSGDYRVVEGGANVVSRVHVADLASMVIGLFHADDGAARGSIYVAADDMPVPQIEVVRWLCQQLGVPLPGNVAVGEAPPSLRHDRSVDNTRIKAALSMTLAHPSYREGFAACLAAEGWRRS